jgi:hypothetical protein
MRKRQLYSWKAPAPHISASSARSPKDGSSLLPISLTQSQIRPFDLSTDESTRMNELKANNNSTQFDPSACAAQNGRGPLLSLVSEHLAAIHSPHISCL